MALTLFNTFVAASLTAQWGLAAAHITTPIIPDCIPPGCMDIIEDQLHSREKMLLDGFSTSSYGGLSFYERYFGRNEKSEKLLGSPEYLRFRQDDPRDKFLFLSAEESHNNALNPKYQLNLLKNINEKYDLKYKVFKSFDEMCDQVDQASKIGKLTNVLIDAHGFNEGLHISGPIEEYGNWIHKNRDYLKCFESLDLLGKITLLGSKTGASTNGDQKDNIAQKIATSAKRTVIAPIGMTFAPKTEMANVDAFEAFHESEDSMKNTLDNQRWWDIFNPPTHSPKNIFKVFHPIYDSCVKVFKDKIHTREQSAIDVVKKASDSKSTLIQPEEFDDLQDLLRFCKDDPRQKFLYLSMESDHNGASHPQLSSHILEPLSKEYDLKFKTVKSYEELCSEVKEAAKMGELLNIVIHGHGNPAGVHISGDARDERKYMIEKNWLHMRRNLAKCFEGADLAKITLFSCSTAAPLYGNPENNIAHSIADATKKTVVAPTEGSYPARTKITSLNPFEVYHLSKCDDYKCESDLNAFQTLKAKKNHES